jgi:hypothetical protein
MVPRVVHAILPERFLEQGYLSHVLTTFLLNSMRGNLDNFETGESRAMPNNFPMLGPKKSGDWANATIK